MVVALMGLLKDINAAQDRHDIGARLEFAEGRVHKLGDRVPKHRLPSPRSGSSFHSSTWHGTLSKKNDNPNFRALHPSLQTNLSENGCPNRAPKFARGVNYHLRKDRGQACAQYQQSNGQTVMFNPNNEQMARLQRAHQTMGYRNGDPQQTGQGQPMQNQGQPQQMQQTPTQQAQQPHTDPYYVPPQSYIHPENQSADQSDVSCPNNCCTTPVCSKTEPKATCENKCCSTPVCSKTEPIPTPVEIPAPAAAPVSTGTVVTPPEVEAVPASGFFWKVTFFSLFVSLAALAWYYYVKHYGKKPARQEPRRWETIRNDVMRGHHYRGQQTPDYGHLGNGYGNYQHQHSVDNQVPLSSYQAPTWERVSKGNKFV